MWKGLDFLKDRNLCYIYLNCIMQCNYFKFRIYLISNEKYLKVLEGPTLYRPFVIPVTVCVWVRVCGWCCGWCCGWVGCGCICNGRMRLRLWRISEVNISHANHRTGEKFIFIAFSVKKGFTVERINVDIFTKERDTINLP